MLLFLVVSSLAPSVITVDAPHATRSLFFFFLLSVYSGVAAEWLLKTTLINQKKLSVCQLCFAVLFFVGVSIETKTYYEKYFSSYPKQSAVILKAGLGEQLNKMETRLSNSPDQVAVVDPDGFHYISVAWALKMSPNQYFASINHHLPDRIGLKYGYRVGRYRFIANREDRLPEDKHIIEWYQDIGHWVTDQSL